MFPLSQRGVYSPLLLPVASARSAVSEFLGLVSPGGGENAEDILMFRILPSSRLTLSLILPIVAHCMPI